VPARLSGFQKPVYARLFAHASFLLAEEGVRRTFASWMESSEGRKGFWDVGANMGIFSFTYANSYPNSPLISFEPDCRNLECLRRTMSVWNSPSHRLVASAVSDHRGKAAFKIDRLPEATGTLIEDGRSFNEHNYAAETRTELVDVVCLDDYYNPERPPSLVKIDVEGAEIDVLRGAAKLLTEATPVLLFESFGQSEECRRPLAPGIYSLFDADRIAPASAETTNFLALNLNKASPELISRFREIGYPL
jgi:FkbM family methyltransferase